MSEQTQGQRAAGALSDIEYLASRFLTGEVTPEVVAPLAGELVRLREQLTEMTELARAHAADRVVTDFAGDVYDLDGEATVHVQVQVRVNLRDYLAARRCGFPFTPISKLPEQGRTRLRHVLHELPPSVRSEIINKIKTIGYVSGIGER